MLEQCLIDADDHDHQHCSQDARTDGTVIHIRLLLAQGHYRLLEIGIGQFQITVELLVLCFKGINLFDDSLRTFACGRQKRLLGILRIGPQSTLHIRDIDITVIFQIDLYLPDIRKQLGITLIDILQQMFPFLYIIGCQIGVYIPLDLLIILLHIASKHHSGQISVTDLIALLDRTSEIIDVISEVNSKNHEQCQIHHTKLCCDTAPERDLRCVFFHCQNSSKSFLPFTASLMHRLLYPKRNSKSMHHSNHTQNLIRRPSRAGAPPEPVGNRRCTFPERFVQKRSLYRIRYRRLVSPL